MNMTSTTSQGTGTARILGLDLSKKTFKACVLTRERNFEDRSVIPGSMEPEGRFSFIKKLGQGDIVAMEGGTSSFTFAREIMTHSEATVVVLNPAKLHIIFKSQVKTDKQDCVKIARYIRDTHSENWCWIPIPSEEESALRGIVNSHDFAKAERTRNINKLHAIFNQHGFPFLKKSGLATEDARVANITEYLDGLALEDALMLHNRITALDVDIKRYVDLMKLQIEAHPEIALPWLSLPGIGVISCATIMAYTWDCSRFSRPEQLRNYVGLVPKVWQSGDVSNMGNVSHFGCKPVRKCIVQGAFSIEKLAAPCQLKDYFNKKKAELKKRQKVGMAVANKMLTIGFALQRGKVLYNGFGNNDRLRSKLKQYGLAIELDEFLDGNTSSTAETK